MPTPRSVAGVALRSFAVGSLLVSALMHIAAEDPVLPPVVIPPDIPVPGDDPPPALEQFVVPEALLLGEGLIEEAVGGVVEPPAMAPPHQPTRPAALILRWDRYRTLVAIDTSAGLVKPCWIVTLTTIPEQIPTARGPITLARGQVVVAYRGQAYLDKNRNLIIDARRARLSGIMANNWSPDSFAISPTKEVTSRDDDPSHPSNSGEVEKEVFADTQRDEYRRLMFTAQSLVEGTL